MTHVCFYKVMSVLAGHAAVSCILFFFSGIFWSLKSVFNTFPLSSLIIFKNGHTVQARRELRFLKNEARSKQAVSVIWAYWQGNKVFAIVLLVSHHPA